MSTRQTISNTDAIARPGDLRISTMKQLAPDGDWQIALAHDRPSQLFIWTTQGQAVALVRGEKRGIGTHNALFVPEGTIFALTPGRGFSGHAITIPPDLGLPLPAEPRLMRCRNVSDQAELGRLIDQMTQEQNTARARYQDAMVAYAQLIAIWVRRQLASDQGTDPDHGAARLLMRAFSAEISLHYRTLDNVAAYARLLDVSPSHLSRVCSAQTGQTAAQLIAERRLHESRRLLIETNVALSDIARWLNFSSPTQFSRFVQRLSGQTPSALRRGHRR